MPDDQYKNMLLLKMAKSLGKKRLLAKEILNE